MKREASSRRVASVVQRAYEAEEEACVQAIEVLLKKPLPRNEGGPETALDDTKESENIGTATDKYSGEPAAGSPGRSRRHSSRTQAAYSVGELEVRMGRQEVDEAPS